MITGRRRGRVDPTTCGSMDLMGDGSADATQDLVWHYTDGTGLLSILSGHELWATSSAFLNDAAEMRRGLDLLGAMTRQRAQTDGGIFEDLVRHLGEVAPEQPGIVPFFILSASMSPDSLAMWRNYGRTRESYAIGLDATAPLSVLVPVSDREVVVRRRPWEPIAYDRARQEDLVARVLDTFPTRVAAIQQAVGHLDESGTPARWNQLSSTREFTELLEDLERAVLLIKDSGFYEEQETRYGVAVYPVSAEPGDRHAAAGIQSYRVSPYGLAPYLRLTGSPDDTDAAVTEQPRRLPIRAVAISPSPNGAAAVESVRAFVHSVGYDVPVTRSTIPFRQ